MLTAARTFRQINDQIQSLQNEATMIMNQARNLTRIDFPELQQLTQTFQQIRSDAAQAFATKAHVIQPGYPPLNIAALRIRSSGAS